MGQSRKWSPAYYYGIPEAAKEIAFFDEFVDESYQWDTRSNGLNIRPKVNAKEDVLYCQSRSQYADGHFWQVPIRPHENYEMEIRFFYSDGPERNPIGLTFGRNMSGEAFSFLVTPQRKYSIHKVNGIGRGSDDKHASWNFSQEIAKYAANRLTVRKVGSEWYFFINERLVAQEKAQNLFGNGVGFTVGGNMTTEIDYLKVSRLRNTDKSGPNIRLLKPIVSGDEVIRFSEPKQYIKGKLSDLSGIKSLKINDTPIRVGPTGEFSASIVLRKANEATPITIIAEDHFGNKSKEELYMSYFPEPPTNFLQPTVNTSTKRGKNYLLVVGINNYRYWNPLHNAVKDGSDIAFELTSRYNFDRNNVVTLYNERATRENILETLEGLQARITENDNLLIYYAGHGFYDQQMDRGYWVPVEARLDKTPDFVRNSTIHDMIKAIESQHTLVIADACYAGTLLADHRSVPMEGKTSRWAFTSGNIEKVWDGQPGQNSPFAKYLLRILRENKKPRLRADDLFDSVSQIVKRNTAQTPVFKPLRFVGDEGGIFVFEKKR